MHGLNSCAAVIVCVIMILSVLALVPVYPARGIPVIPVRLSNDDCGDSREIVLRIGADGELALNGKKIRRDALGTQAAEQLRTRFEKVVFVEAHGSLAFRSVAEVLGDVQSLSKVALIPQISRGASFACMALPAAPVWMPGTIALPKPSLHYVALWAR